MKKNWESHAAYVIFTVLIMLAVGYSYFFEYLPKHQVETKKSAALALAFDVVEKSLHLDVVVKSTDCAVQGSLPDHDCTPGTVFKNVDQAIICVQGYTKTVRSVSVATRKKVFAEYNIAWPEPFGSYETDHLIPLALGGSNEIANLFPEAASPYPGFKEKDVVENYLHEQVCAGSIALSAAQEQIANNWLLIYNNLSEQTIKDLKNKYKSWAK